MGNRINKSIIAWVFLAICLSACTAVPTQTPVPPSPAEILITPTKLENLATATEYRQITQTVKPTSTLPVPTHTATPSLTPTPILSPIAPGWIAFAGARGDVSVGIIRTDGTGLMPLTSDCDFCYSVSWSPDGHWLAFDASYYYMDMLEIYITRMDGSETRRVTFGPHIKTNVAWSPDGQYIAYTEVSGDWTDDICIVNVDNEESQKLTFTSEAESSPAWSPDGLSIAFLRLLLDEGPGAYVTWALMVMDEDGSNVRQVTDFTTGRGRVAWSPDGQQIAFTSSGDCGEIYTVRVDGSDLRQLTNLPGCTMNPTWSPDGRYIAFESSESETPTFQWQLNIMNVDGSGITPIYSAHTGSFFRPDWKPVPSLYISDSYVITEAGAGLNLRSEPSLSGTSMLSLQAGDVVTVLEGSVDAEDYYWWKLQTEDGMEGWAVEMYGWFLPVSP